MPVLLLKKITLAVQTVLKWSPRMTSFARCVDTKEKVGGHYPEELLEGGSPITMHTRLPGCCRKALTIASTPTFHGDATPRLTISSANRWLAHSGLNGIELASKEKLNCSFGFESRCVWEVISREKIKSVMLKQ
ncbi:hypothetical protein RRG08_011068 [Elysia crispata]|uniref:Uncharacterized protein n=1 Tax=Elysia crispata TaxID=231223 RepID=A0AAE0ZAB9_9GAST|nr:hypothetical protein RRG08_011068 [Elysia crispata]